MYRRNNAEKLLLSISRNWDFDNATSITIFNNDKSGKNVIVDIIVDNPYRMELSIEVPTTAKLTPDSGSTLTRTPTHYFWETLF